LFREPGRLTLPADPDAAEPILAEVLHGMKNLAPDDPIVAFTTGLLFRCVVVRKRTAPDAWTTFNAMSLLGGALPGQKKYADVEPLLLKGYEGMKAREKSIPPQAGTRIPEAIDRLIEFYTATNKPDEAKKWRAERARYPEVAPPPREKK
jgi:hypothetical protein